MKKFFKEFGEFINRGNIMSLAIGVVIGAAFQAIVNSLVNDIIMPLLSLLTKGNLAEMVWIMRPESAEGAGDAVALKYGAFIQAIINFLIIAFSIFLAMKAINTISERTKKLGEKVKDKVGDVVDDIKKDMEGEETKPEETK